MKTYLDLSHVIEDGLVTYQGLPAPVIRDHLSRQDSRRHYAPGTEFQIGRIEMVANTGTYLDSPSHRYPDGPDLSGLPLVSLADLPGVVIRVPTGVRAIGPEVLTTTTSWAGRAVLFHTGWSRHWRTPAYFSGHPFLTAALAQSLVDARVALIGIDSYNIDDTADLARPVHTGLLRAGIPIVEHMTGLERLPPSGLRLFAVPPKIKGLGTFPVRAFAIVDGEA